MLRRACLALLFGSVFAISACSGDGDTSGSGGSGSGGAGSGSGGAGSGSGGAGTGGGSASLGGPFRYGINMGHRNQGWGDDKHAFLSHEAGANSARLKLSEAHLDKWGYDIEVADMNYYASLGMGDHVAFLNEPAEAHSTAPAGTPTWQLGDYIPQNLYEPVFLPDQSINPNNYWGAYVYQTVSTYKSWVKVWEVWNEPDWVSDWKVPQNWETNPPTKDELVRFGGSIYDYVRMLRVSYEAAKKADPDAEIALGGIGYASFLSAILRYTDNPADGSVSAEYPATGASYFDVVSFHHYPLSTPGSSDVAVNGFLSHKDELAKVLSDAKVSGKTWMVTESGAPHVVIPNRPSGTEYAYNYLLKVMVKAQEAGIRGIDWFTLSDGALEGASTNPYDYMGLYVDIANLMSTDQAVRTESGIAYRTLGSLLSGARIDTTASAELALPNDVAGAAFRLPDMRRAWVLWAQTGVSDEVASASYDLAVSGGVSVYEWDYAQTGKSNAMAPSGGKVSLSLSGTPVIVIEG